MFNSYLLPSILTLSFTSSWRSSCGFQNFWKRKFPNDVFSTETKPYNIPTYMWDIYNNGVNFSEIDVVKSVFPKFSSSSFKLRSYRNHRRKEIEFIVPESKQHETLVGAEVRIMTNKIKNRKGSFQIYLKSSRWVFLDEKKISETDWVSLQVTSSVKKLGAGSIKFLILAHLSEFEDRHVEQDYLNPNLLLSYFTQYDAEEPYMKLRKKRSLNSEDYEEKTNRIRKDEDFSDKKLLDRLKTSCRRKPLYIKFSDIDYDSWIVAPTGYEAFQCVGKCSFPVSEHLSPTKHAILQTLLHNISPSKAPRACCVPTKLEPISVLYIDGNGVLTYRFRYQDMVVAECGCR